MARVLVSTDVPARVGRLQTLAASDGTRRVSGTVDDLLCERTPCAVVLPYGDHELSFQATDEPERTSSTIVHVHESAVVVNHSLGRRHASEGRGAGVALAVVGLLVTCGSLGVMSAAQKAGSAQDPSAPRAAIGVGLGLLVLGGLVSAAAPTTVQPGATTQWSPAQNGGSLGAALGATF
jgi:hypothetical protein